MPTDRELQVMAQIINHAFGLGYFITVHDGKKIPVTDSTDRAAIIEAATAAGQATLIFRKQNNGRRVGSIFIVFGNAADGSELAAKHSRNRDINRLVDLADAARSQHDTQPRQSPRSP